MAALLRRVDDFAYGEASSQSPLHRRLLRGCVRTAGPSQVTTAKAVANRDLDARACGASLLAMPW
eukprot:292399-Heterocapsa_arctica.AAC.1